MAGPRLLDKKVVNAELATQKKQQIDSGLAMAKKVDVIRQTLQEEEKNLEQFRQESVSRVKIEIDSQIAVLDEVKRQIKDRQVELAELQIPLDKKWEDITKAQAICNDWELTLEQKEYDLDQHLKDIETSERELEVEKGRIIEMKRITVDKLNHAEDNLLRANTEAIRIRAQTAEKLASAELRTKMVVGREEGLQSTLVWIEKEKKRFTALEADLAKRERVLKDRYETLARTLKRQK